MIRALVSAVILLAGQGLLPAAFGADEVPPVIKAMREEISARPSRVLISVEDALTMDEQAACEIVKEAITSTRADAKLTGEIVRTALQHAPGMSAVIVECAMAVAPGAAQEIENAIRSVLGTSTVKTAPPPEAPGNSSEPEADSGKESSGSADDKTGAKAAPDSLDSFLPGAVGVGGIYLISPSRAFRPCLPGDFCCSGALSPSCLSP
jgi:hypothetical protein